MIYLPGKAVFIHIPRTAGNSITNTIASVCIPASIDIILGTNHWDLPNFYQVSRHVPAFDLKNFIPEWDNIFKFAIHRPHLDRIESFARLVKRERECILRSKCIPKPTADQWFLRLALSENYYDKIKNDWSKQDTDWFTLDRNGSDLGVHIYDYKDLNNVWPEICKRCLIPHSPLSHLGSSKNYD